MFIIYIAFIMVMVLLFISGVVFIAIKSFDTKEPLKKKTLLFLKKMGVYAPVAIAVIYLVYRLLMGYFEKECGPNPEDVKVMTPQAEAISNYILKNGIPKSLADIPNLPYALENCKWADENVEWCYFDINENKYSTRLYFVAYDNGIDIDVRIHSEKSETGMFTEIEKISNGTFEVVEHLKAYSTKDDGICNPMRM